MNFSNQTSEQHSNRRRGVDSSSGDTSEDGRSLRVLIAEDDPLAAIGLRLLLTNMGHMVVAEARNGREAVNQAKAHKPDLILMDIKMPGGQDGIEATRIILQHRSTAVILVTAYHDEDTIQRGKEAGALAYLIKPVSEHELKIAVDKVSGRRAN
jgi:two-component system, response regulator PdtaR